MVAHAVSPVGHRVAEAGQGGVAILGVHALDPEVAAQQLVERIAEDLFGPLTHEGEPQRITRGRPEAVHFGHDHVDEHQGQIFAQRQAQRLLAGGGLVVDDEDFGRYGRHGCR
jgi:hypothetical protein